MNTSIQQIDNKSTYKKLRIDLMVHLGARAFEEIGSEVVKSVAFVLEKRKQ